MEQVTKYIDGADKIQIVDKPQRTQTERATKYANKVDEAQTVDKL